MVNDVGRFDVKQLNLLELSSEIKSLRPRKTKKWEKSCYFSSRSIAFVSPEAYFGKREDGGGWERGGEKEKYGKMETKG